MVCIGNNASTQIPHRLGRHQAIPHAKVKGYRISESIQAAVPVGCRVSRRVVESRGLGPDCLGVIEERLPRDIEPIIGRKPVVRIKEELKW